ncbi:MAG: hypothetical protein E7311_03135 [Clostridiales bacterium]|nr:hypothetical protein [Clostridiales bacterium]
MKYDVCVFGGCALDMIYYQNSDGTYNDEPTIKEPGGKGANQAVAASRAGAKTTIISRVGNDEIGKSIIENLLLNRVDVSNVEIIDGIQNDYSKIRIRVKDKDNEIERFSGAINTFTPDMVDKYSEVLLNSAIIVCQLKIPKETTERLINFCHKHNKVLILTPCRPEKLSITDKANKKLLDKITLITCNEKECKTIFNTDNIETCIEKYPNKLIVTLGNEGLIYHNGKRVVKMSSINVEVIDTIGAGDTLNGNLVAFLSKGVDLQHALRKAMYAATMKLQVKSAQKGMPYYNELEEFIFRKRNKNFSYSEELDFAISIVKEAYNQIKENTNFRIFSKEDNTLVTDIDIAIEKFLIKNIKKKFKKDVFLTEESFPDTNLQDRCWIIDPIDGTNHFIKGNPYWGIQLAFYDKGHTRFSIIYLPKLDEFYYAAENQGVYLNNNKILNIPVVPLNQTVVEFGGSVYKELDSKKIYFNKLIKQDKMLIGNILHINSCARSFTNLVSGKTDALIFATRKLWDIMPGMFLCEEAGIKVYALDFEKKLRLLTLNEELKNIILD